MRKIPIETALNTAGTSTRVKRCPARLSAFFTASGFYHVTRVDKEEAAALERLKNREIHRLNTLRHDMAAAAVVQGEQRVKPVGARLNEGDVGPHSQALIRRVQHDG